MWGGCSPCFCAAPWVPPWAGPVLGQGTARAGFSPGPSGHLAGLGVGWGAGGSGACKVNSWGLQGLMVGLGVHTVGTGAERTPGRWALNPQAGDPSS